jgi:hypothetical protein
LLNSVPTHFLRREKQQRTNKYRIADRRKTADSKQQTADIKQQAADNT